jgi:hypothetical protein
MTAASEMNTIANRLSRTRAGVSVSAVLSLSFSTSPLFLTAWHRARSAAPSGWTGASLPAA